MQVTLSINCSTEQLTISSKPPMYYCKEIPLAETPLDTIDSTEYFAYLEQVYNWIELERTNFERSHVVDTPPVPYNGPTDELGDPIKSASEQKRDKDAEAARKWPRPRVLLYSRLGIDRPCFVVAAYLVRRWGVTAEKAIEIVSQARPDALLSDPHWQVLHQWAAAHNLGNRYCDDCGRHRRAESQAPVHLGVEDGGVVVDPATHKDLTQLSTSLAPSEVLQTLPPVGRWLLPIPSDGGLSTRLSVLTGAPTSLQLYDLCLSGQRVTDAAVDKLFQALLKTNLTCRLKRISLANNLIACDGVIAMTIHLRAGARDKSKAASALVTLDLSQNRFLYMCTYFPRESKPFTIQITYLLIIPCIHQ